MRRQYFFILLLLLAVCGCSVCRNANRPGKDVSPYEFGLRECRTDVERYKVLLLAHQTALARGVGVDYSGIRSVNIEVPDKKSTIPLSASTDFQGCVFNVKNTVGDVVLFSRIATMHEASLLKAKVDSRDYSSIPALRRGLHLVVLEDKTPWVENREGHDYPAYRKDVVIVKDGKAQNATIMPYNTRQTNLVCSYAPIRDTAITISNIVINRTKESTKKTFCFAIRGVYNVRMNNVTVNTPEETGLWADGVIKVRDCAVVALDGIKINGTYSLIDKYGYGFDLDNVYDFRLTNSYGHGKWGVFGTNNINRLSVEDCDLNRVDIHLYGRDVRIADCKLSGAYNQFSGVYGDIVMERCHFSNFTPLINGTSYNAYVPYNLYVRDCVWDVTPEKCTLLSMGSLKDKINSRDELSKKSWPNVYIDRLTVNVPAGVKNVTVLNIGSEVTYEKPVGNLSVVDIKGVTFKYDKTAKEAASLVVCNRRVDVENAMRCSLKDVHLLKGGESQISQAKEKYLYPGSVIFNLHSKAGEDVSVSSSSVGYNVNSNYEYDLAYDNCTLAYVRCAPSDLREFGTKRRTYRNCRLFLNNGDSNKYFIDNLASYEGCEFIPCSNLEIDFYGKAIDVKFKDCSTSVKKGVRYTKALSKVRLNGGRFDGKKWTKE